MALRNDKPLKDVTGRYLTRALFKELADGTEEKYPPLCTLKEAHDLYMQVSDPTEYEFAKALLESPETNFYDQWQRLLNTPDFMVYLEKWRDELEIKLRSAAVRAIRHASTSDKGFQAAKWLAERGWGEKKVGRPSKEEQVRQNRIEDALHKELTADEARILN